MSFRLKFPRILSLFPWKSSRVRTPVVLQMEVTECGAASLAIILAYFGKWLPLEVVREACGVTRDGSNAQSILLAARSYGLESKGYTYQLPSLMSQKPPFIVFWKFHHFLVVEGFSHSAVYLNDPATGPRTVTYREFNKGYTGIMLQFKPTEAFVRSEGPPLLWPILFRRLKKLKSAFGASFLLSLMLILPGVLLAAFSYIFIDEIVMNKQVNWQPVLLTSMVVVIVLQSLMTWMTQWILLRMENHLSLAGSSQILWHLLRLPYTFFTQRLPGELVSRLRANDQLAMFLGQDLGRTLCELVAASFYVLIVLFFDPFLALITISLTSVSVLITVLARQHLHEISLKGEMEEAKVFSNTAVAIQGVETIRATGSENMVFSLWSGYHTSRVNIGQQLSWHTTLVQSSSILTNGLVTAAVLGFGSWRVMKGDLSVGGVVAIQAMVTAFKPSFESLAGLLTRLKQAQASIWRIDDISNYQLDRDFSSTEKSDFSPSTKSTEKRKVQLDGHIEVQSVSFGYNITKGPLITDLNLSVEPGMRVALVGGTGSGKSTIAKLMAGLYQPWSGHILLDGKQMEQWPLSLRKSSIGWVNQENFLFEGTVMDHLTLWDKSLPEQTILQATQDAEIHNVIVNRPGGYNSPVLEGGINFSGGERQRLELARVLAMDPSILILDEAMSALDPHVEVTIDGHLRRRGCTILVIAHRLSTIRDCDEILVLDQGRVIERGTHQTLIKNKGRYRGLVEH